MVELERWLPVVGYQAYYSISDIGRVRREMASSGRTWKGRILKAPIRSNGYRAVTLFGQDHTPNKQEIHNSALDLQETADRAYAELMEAAA